MQRGSTWYCFFNATGDVGAVTGVERIGYATAPSITGPWTVDDTNSPLLDLGGPGWDSQIVGDPSVRRVGNLWVMDYYGSNGTNARDGIATTSDAVFPLGWVKYASNPILSPTTGTYDGQHAHKPFTIQRGGEVLPLLHRRERREPPPDRLGRVRARWPTVIGPAARSHWPDRRWHAPGEPGHCPSQHRSTREHRHYRRQ